MRKRTAASELQRQVPELEEKPLSLVREEAEREHILSVLQRTKGNRARTARILGISRKTLWKKLKRLGADSPTTLPNGNT